MWHLRGPGGERQGGNTCHIFICAVERGGGCQRKRSREATVTVEDTLPKPLSGRLPRAAQSWPGAKVEHAGLPMSERLKTCARRAEPRPGPASRGPEKTTLPVKAGVVQLKGLRLQWEAVRIGEFHGWIWRAYTYLLSIGTSEAAADCALQYARVQKTRSWHQRTIALRRGTAGIPRLGLTRQERTQGSNLHFGQY